MMEYSRYGVCKKCKSFTLETILGTVITTVDIKSIQIKTNETDTTKVYICQNPLCKHIQENKNS